MKTLKSILFIVILSFITSCTHYYYAPNSVNAPLFDTTNALKSNLVTGFGDEFTSREVQIAYSLPKNVLEDFFVAGNYFYVNEESIMNDKPQNNNATFYEFAAGYTQKLSSSFLLEYQLQYGGGHVFNTYDKLLFNENGQGYIDTTFEYSNFDISKLSAQIALGWKYGILELVAGTRFGNVSITPNVIAITPDNSEMNNVKVVLDNKNTSVFEPFVIGRIGLKNIKLQLQYVESKNITIKNYPQEKANFSIGIHLDLTDILRDLSRVFEKEN